MARVSAKQIRQRGAFVATWSRIAVITGVALMLGSCSTVKGYFSDDDIKKPPIKAAAAVDDKDSVGRLYNKAVAEMREGNFTKAAKAFEEVERQYPYSTWARRAILMAAYSRYEVNNYDAAIVAARRFIQLHPGNKDTAYAYYLVGLSFYEQIADVGRDQGQTKKAFEALSEVSRRFPDSHYAKDAERKALLAKDHLAGKEMKIGRYYLRKQSYIAAINRFRTVITKYQTTSHTPEALERLTEAYFALGIQAEAQTAAAVLGHNWPQSQWYRDAYALLRSGGLEPRENKQSWISKAWKSVF